MKENGNVIGNGQPVAPFFQPLTDQEVHDIAWADMRGQMWGTWNIVQKELVSEITLAAFPSLLFLTDAERKAISDNEVVHFCQYYSRGVPTPINRLTNGAFTIPAFSEAIMVSKTCYNNILMRKKYIERAVSEIRPPVFTAADIPPQKSE